MKKNVADLEIARSRLTQEGGDLGKQVEEYESKLNVLLKSKKTLETTVEELKRQNEEETRVSFQSSYVIYIHFLLTLSLHFKVDKVMRTSKIVS